MNNPTDAKLLERISGLEKRVQELELLVNTGPDFFFLKDLQLRYQLINSANADFFGRDKADILGRTDVELMSEGAALACQESDRQAIREKRMVVSVEPVGEKFYETRKFPVIDKDKIVGVAGIIRDITDRKQTELALRTRQLQLFEAMDLANIVYWDIDPADNVYIFNDPFYALYGTTAEQEGGYRMTREEYAKRFIHPDDRQLVCQFVKQNSTSPEPEFVADIEHRIVRRDGEVRHMLVRARIVKDDSGRIIKRYGANQDITERRRTEEALRQSERTLRSLIDATREPVLLIDPEGKILAANEALAQRLGKSVLEVIGTCQYDYFPPDVATRRRAEYDRVVRTGNPVHFQDERAGRAYDSYGYPVLNDEGRVTRVAIFVYDVTERKALESQLLQAQKMEAIGTLAGGIAHDFNNILMAIMGFTGLIEMTTPKDHPTKSYLHEINSCASKAANLTRSLLTFSRKQAIELRPQNIGIILADAEKLLRRLVPEDVNFTVMINQDLLIMADTTQIHQILINLVSNAKDAMPKGGTLHIEARVVELDKEFRQTHGFGDPGQYAVISVTDTGTGMNEATQKKIFEPFFTTKEVGKGTGLGLSIVYGIIKQHGGYITVSSEIGRGTTFDIYLPAVKVAISEAGQTSIQAEGGTETILLAEDDADVRQTVKEILRMSGYTIVEAKDGEHAVRQYMDHRDRIDLLILDMVMPVKNGKEAYEEMHKIDPTIRALFMSGYTGDAILDKGLQGTTVNYVSKPILADELLKKIREVLER